MEGLALLVIVALLWMLLAPIAGLIAIKRSRRIETELIALRKTVERLSRDPETERMPSENKGVDIADTRPAPDQSDPVSKEDLQPEQTPSSPPKAAFADSPPVVRPASDSPKRDWEHIIAANWIIWAGGLALAIGALFLVRTMIEAGYFGPFARTLSAAGVGLALIAAGWWMDRKGQHRLQSGAMRFLPSILAGSGIIALYGACSAAGMLFGLAPPLLIFAALIVTSLLAVGLSLLFGPALAAIGLTGAYFAPFFTGAEEGSPLLMLPYAASITVAGLSLITWRSWRFMAWITLAGSLLWGVICVSVNDNAASWAVPVYALFLTGAATLFSWQQSEAPIEIKGGWKTLWADIKKRGDALLTAYLFWVAGGMLLAISLLNHHIASHALTGFSLYCGFAVFTAWKREGLAYVAPLSAVLVFVLLALWRNWAGEHTAICFVVAVGFGFSGWLLHPKVQLKTPLAATSALSPPIALFLAFWRSADLEKSLFWGLGALFIAMVMITILETMRRSEKGFEGSEGAAASYTLGAILSIAIAPYLITSDLWLGSGAAVAAAGMALTHQRFGFALLRYSSLIAAAIAVFFLVRPGPLLTFDVSPTPVFNELTASFGLAIMALAAAGVLLSERKRYSDGLFGAAAILGFSLVGLLIRHWAGGGQLDGPFGGYAEASGYAIAYLGSALSLAWRFGRDRGVLLRVAEYGSLAIGFGGILTAMAATDWDVASGLPLFNLLFPAFAMPAVLLGAYAHCLRQKDRLTEANGFGLAAIVLGLLWVSLEVRRLYHGPDLFDPLNSTGHQGEMWGLSAGWLAYALALLGWGVWRGRTVVRYASLGVLMLTIAKVFLFDLSSTEGVWRAASFIGLGLALLAVALFYQRFVFNSTKPPNEVQAEPA